MVQKPKKAQVSPQIFFVRRGNGWEFSCEVPLGLRQTVVPNETLPISETGQVCIQCRQFTNPRKRTGLFQRPDNSSHSLDPSDWVRLREQAHKMLDGMLDYLSSIEERPVWQPPAGSALRHLDEPLPASAHSLEATYSTFERSILPYAIGNAHPGFMGWAHGGGSVVGMLAEMLAAGLNANLGGRDHIPIAVEQQIVRWMSRLFGFPESASGLFVTGSSIANFMAILIARTRMLGTEVRAQGLTPAESAGAQGLTPAESAGAQGLTPAESAQGQTPRGQLTAYASRDAHGCVAQALELAGIGSNHLRRIPVDRCHRIDINALVEAIERDRSAGSVPFCVVGSSGTVDVGAVDDLTALADVAKRFGLWFHVDGACGALGMLSPKIAPRLRGIERADSIALDFHKWGQVPYDAGFLLVRDRQIHHDTFASPAAYLRRETRGMAAGSPWPCDFGPDLSRSFKALKVWFTFQVYGADRLGGMIEHTCELAQYLAGRIQQSSDLQLLADVQMNIVCFRFCIPDRQGLDWERINAQIIVEAQESGIAAPSATTVDGHVAIRAAIFNHRTTEVHIDRLIDTVLKCGHRIVAESMSN